jgi:hypothetical protein
MRAAIRRARGPSTISVPFVQIETKINGDRRPTPGSPPRVADISPSGREFGGHSPQNRPLGKPCPPKSSEEEVAHGAEATMGDPTA